MEKYVNEKGEIGVIISGGYGAGWSTWNSEHSEFLLMDKTLVSMKMDKFTDDDVLAYLNKVLGGEAPYLGGWRDAKVVFLKKGTVFNVNEYDGNETIETLDDLCFTA